MQHASRSSSIQSIFFEIASESEQASQLFIINIIFLTLSLPFLFPRNRFFLFYSTISIILNRVNNFHYQRRQMNEKNGSIHCLYFSTLVQR